MVGGRAQKWPESLKPSDLQTKNISFRPPSDIKVTYHQIPAWQDIPNISIQSKPLMIYHGAFDATPAELEGRLEAVGEVVPQWRFTMYSTTHFHSTTHEVLGIVAGQARLCFGGEENPERFELTVRRGDLIIVPARVGHRLLEDQGDNPEWWDMCYGEAGEEEKAKKIQDLAWFRHDPLYGDGGPALHV